MGYGDGTVVWDPKRQRYIGRFEVHDGSPKRRRGHVTARTEAEAWAKIRKKRKTLAALPAYDERLRLDDFLRRWLRDMQATVRDRTAANYASQVEGHLIPALGGHRLVDLRPEHVRRYRDEKLADGYSPRTVTHHLKALRAALGHGMREGLIERNVATLVPGPHIPKADVRPLNLAQALNLLEQVRSDPYEAVYVLAVTLGMRQGEILGLRWSDVAPAPARHRGSVRDVSAASDVGGTVPALGAGATLTIRKSLVWLNGRATLEDTKTDSSRRTLTLPRRAVEALERRRVIQNLNRIEASDDWNPKWDATPLVFTDRDGYAVERTAITRALYRHLDAAGLPRVTFHQLRHGMVGIAKQDFRMATEEIAGVAGHASMSETTDTYMHLDDRSAELARHWDEVTE